MFGKAGHKNAHSAPNLPEGHTPHEEPIRLHDVPQMDTALQVHTAVDTPPCTFLGPSKWFPWFDPQDMPARTSS